MQVLQGKLPDNRSWRVMVLLAPNETVTLPWEVGLLLSRGNKGALLAAVVLEPNQGRDSAEFAAAQKTLATVNELCNADDQIEQIIVQPSESRQTLQTLVERARVDMLVTDLESPHWRVLNNLPCTVATLRFAEDTAEAVQRRGIRRILLPTSGGPHTIHALQFLAPISTNVAIDAAFISRTSQGENEVGLGKQRLEQMLNSADAAGRVTPRIVSADSARQGIVDTANEDYDLVVLGASNESSIDKVLFGDVVNGVVRESKVPVMVVRRPQDRGAALLANLDFRLRSIVPRLSRAERDEVYVRIRENAKPDLDYFVLITLSAAIAALGLVLNSPAVVIGAMLVAPLMSPIVATGMSLILGDARFLRFAAGSALRGAVVAIFVGVLIGLMPGDNLTSEVLARTAPNILDLGVALFSGLAGAFALSYWQAAGALPGVAIAAALVPPLASVGIAFAEGEWELGLGALLLFLTNYVTIAVASAFVFAVFGFRPNPTAKAERRIQLRSTQVALVSLVAVAIVLTITTIELVRGQNRDAIIDEVTTEQVESVFGLDAAVTGWAASEPAEAGAPFELRVEVESSTLPTDAQLDRLRTEMDATLQERISLEAPLQLKLLHRQIQTIVPSTPAE